MIPIMLMLLLPSALAQTTQTICTTNETLQITVNSTRCIEDICKEFSTSTNQFCPNGCDSTLNVCIPDDSSTALIVAGAIVLFVALIVAVVRMTK